MISEKNVRQTITISKEKLKIIRNVCIDYDISYSEFFKKAVNNYLWQYFQDYITIEEVGHIDD